jgi:hypothetical protein
MNTMFYRRFDSGGFFINTDNQAELFFSGCLFISEPADSFTSNVISNCFYIRNLPYLIPDVCPSPFGLGHLGNIIAQGIRAESDRGDLLG